MSPADIRPGQVLEWRYTPNWSVTSRIEVLRIDPDGHAWVRHEDSGTLNRLSLSALGLNARPAHEPPPPLWVLLGLAIAAWAVIGGLVWLWWRT